MFSKWYSVVFCSILSSRLVLYAPHLNTKRQKPHNGSLSCANNSKQTAWTPHKSELSRSPSNGRHAADSSACSSPRHNRNDWFPAEAEAQGAHSPPWGSLNPPCDKLFRWTYCVRNKTLRVNPAYPKGTNISRYRSFCIWVFPWSMHSEIIDSTLKYPAHLSCSGTRAMVG